MRFWLPSLLAVCLLLASGCLESTENNQSSEKFRCSDGRIVAEPMLCINERTTTFETTSVLELSTSSRPPTLFPTTSSSTTVKPIEPVFKTTTLLEPCANAVLDDGEDIIDCGSSCFCRILQFTHHGEQLMHEPSGYLFAWNNTVTVKEGECGLGDWPSSASYFHKDCKNTKQVFNATTPSSLVDVRYLTGGNSYFIDRLEFGILQENESDVIIAVRQDPETRNLTKPYTVMSVGGSGCEFKDVGLCQRKYGGYTLRLIERETERVKLQVTAPDGDSLPSVWVGATPVQIRDLSVGAIRPITLGGYATLYVR